LGPELAQVIDGDKQLAWIGKRIASGGIYQQAGAANTRDDFAYALYQHLEELLVNRMDRNGGQTGMFLDYAPMRFT